MSVSTYISAIEANRNTIRNKLIEMGMAQSGDKLDKLATVIENLVNQGAVSVTVQEGETYTIPKGYHNGNGTVSGIAGGGNYKLQAKTATPTKSQQNIVPDSGYYGLSGVTMAAIPETYQDVSSVTAGADNVLTGKVFVAADGTVTAGTMVNNGAVNVTLSGSSFQYQVKKGYHDGTGLVKISLENKTVTPSKTEQQITPSTGKVLSLVTVEAIPEQMVDTSDANATAADMADGVTAYVNGAKVTGTMQELATITLHSSEITLAQGANGSELRIEAHTEKGAGRKLLQDGASVYTRVVASKLGDATASNVLAEKTFTSKAGVQVAGTMANNGSMNKAFDGMTTTSVEIPAGYTSGGTVSLTSDIENALAAI